jgi:hypothetical protein
MFNIFLIKPIPQEHLSDVRKIRNAITIIETNMESVDNEVKLHLGDSIVFNTTINDDECMWQLFTKNNGGSSRNHIIESMFGLFYKDSFSDSGILYCTDKEYNPISLTQDELIEKIREKIIKHQPSGAVNFGKFNILSINPSDKIDFTKPLEEITKQITDTLNIVETNSVMFTSDIIHNIDAKPESHCNTIIIEEDEHVVWQMCYVDIDEKKMKPLNPESNIPLSESNSNSPPSDSNSNSPPSESDSNSPPSESDSNSPPSESSAQRVDEPSVVQRNEMSGLPRIPVNHIASFINQEKKHIYGPVVFFGSKVNDKGTCENMSVTFDDLLNIIKRRKNYVGCGIMSNNKIIEFDASVADTKDMQCYEFQLYGSSGFSFEMFYKNDINNIPINKFATILSKKKIYGNVLLLQKSSEHNYVDITKDTLRRLIKVCRSPIQYHESQTDESNVERNDKGLLVLKNRWWFLKKREKEFHDKFTQCWNCTNKFKLTCTGCYRLRYCSEECRKKDWAEHNCNSR